LPIHGRVELVLSFGTVPGLNYFLEYKNNLNDLDWVILPALVGDGAVKTVTNALAAGSQRFYRLRVE
jgi:hypothetical protein